MLPREATEAVALLRQHNIAVEQLTRPMQLDVTAYTVADVTHAPQYNHAAATTVKVGEVKTFQRIFPAGSYVVRTAQMQGRVAVHLLEPETTDGVVYWNRMDAWIPRPRSATATAPAPDDEDAPQGRGGRGGGAGAGAGRGGIRRRTRRRTAAAAGAARADLQSHAADDDAADDDRGRGQQVRLPCGT